MAGSAAIARLRRHEAETAQEAALVVSCTGNAGAATGGGRCKQTQAPLVAPPPDLR